MFDPEFQRKALSLVMGFIMQFSETPAEPEVITKSKKEDEE